MRQGGRCGTLGSGLALMLALAGCTSVPEFRQVSLPLPSEAALDAQPSKAAARESSRILASYGGIYENPKLQAIIVKTVARLVAASEQPELTYQVTVLNSPAINAFALPIDMRVLIGSGPKAENSGEKTLPFLSVPRAAI